MNKLSTKWLLAAALFPVVVFATQKPMHCADRVSERLAEVHPVASSAMTAPFTVVAPIGFGR